jgi:hypothetical protein
MKKRSCLGCQAWEPNRSILSCCSGDEYCSLGYKTEKFEGAAGFYGKNKMLIAVNIRPCEDCPKPRTEKQLVKIYSKPLEAVK